MALRAQPAVNRSQSAAFTHEPLFKVAISGIKYDCYYLQKMSTKNVKTLEVILIFNIFDVFCYTTVFPDVLAETSRRRYIRWHVLLSPIK